MSEPIPTVSTQSPFTYPNPNPSASPSFTQDDTSDSFIPEPTQSMPSFTQTAFSQPAVNYQQVFNQSIYLFTTCCFTLLTVSTNSDHITGNSPKRLGKDDERKYIVHSFLSLLMRHVLFTNGKNKLRLGLVRIMKDSKKMRKTLLKQRLQNSHVTEEEGYTSVMIGAFLILCAAPHHSAFMGAARLWLKAFLFDQRGIVPSSFQNSGRSDNIMECVLAFFWCCECNQIKIMIYEDFDSNLPDLTEKERLDATNVFKMGHILLGRCNVKTVDDKARFSAFKVTTGEVEKVYGMMAGIHTNNGGAGVSDAAANALEEKIRVLSANLENTTNTLSYTEKLHDQAQNEKKEWEVKYEATLARFDKWKESSKNLKKLINSSMSTRTKIGLSRLGSCMQFLPPSCELTTHPVQADTRGNTDSEEPIAYCDSSLKTKDPRLPTFVLISRFARVLM
ncbi:hypothetical protein Tco_0789060 [Tanacetum coccineum]